MLNEKIIILLVDDDENYRKVFTKGLVGQNFEVLQAATATEAIHLIQTQSLDMVLLDIHLNDLTGMNGLEVLQKVRTKVSLIHLPVIIFTGSIDDDMVVRALERGANDYITKPTKFSVALARIKTHLTIRRLELELENQRSRVMGSAQMLALGELAAGASHEINNPLAIICAKASRLESILLKTKFEYLTEALADIEVIKKTGFRIGRIVDAISRFSSVSIDSALQSINIEDFIADALLLCNPRLKNGNISLLMPEQIPSVKIFGRQSEMSQVICNLLSNSCDAVVNLQERWVRIDVEINDSEVFLSVTDSGVDLPLEIQSRVFHPFFTTKPVGKGIGIGLSQALGIVKSFGGKIELDTTSKNTRFVVRLMRAPTKY